MKVPALAFLALTLVAGCDAVSPDVVGKNEAPLDCSNFSSSFATEDSMQQPTGTFIVGETITLHARITNNGSTDQTVHGANCPYSSFEIMDASGQAVWSWGSDMQLAPFMTCVDDYTYAPGETTEPEVDWNQRRADDNTAVPPGLYTAVLSDSTECGGTLGKSVAFEIQ